jgi:hypothetical protein
VQHGGFTSFVHNFFLQFETPLIQLCTYIGEQVGVVVRQDRSNSIGGDDLDVLQHFADL